MNEKCGTGIIFKGPTFNFTLWTNKTPYMWDDQLCGTVTNYVVRDINYVG